MRVVGFDTETHLFSPGNMAPKIVCLSWAEGERSGLVVGVEEIERWLHQHFGDPEVLLVGHVTAYDTACILAGFPSVGPKVWKAYEGDRVACTAIRERLLDIANGEFRGRWVGEKVFKKYTYHMADIAQRRLGVEVAKGEDTWRLRYAELDSVPLQDWPTEAVRYAVGDAETTLQIYLSQEKRARQISYSLPTQFEDARGDFALRLTSVWGIETDAQQVGRIWDETVLRMEALVPGLEAAGLVEVVLSTVAGRKPIPDVRKSLQAIRSVIASCYPGELPRTPTGKVATGKNVIAVCQHEALTRLTEFSALQKAASTYLRKLFAPVIHASYYAVGAASDRTSCSGPNMQNQPRLPGVRECFVPRPGRVFLACDFDAQEMRTLAQSCLDIVGSSRLAERFLTDRHFDPHLEFAAGLLKIEVDEAMRRKKVGDPEIKAKRQQSKAANFGYPGGMGAKKFVEYARGYGVALSETESAELRTSWFEQWPEMVTYFRHVSSLVGSADVGVQTIPQSGFRRGAVGYSDAANGYFQTLAAHASKASLFRVCERAYNRSGSALYGSRPVLFIHDEIVLEVREEGGAEAAQELEQVMVETMERWTPGVPAAASATLMRRWSKAAEQVYDRGRLVAWDMEEP